MLKEFLNFIDYNEYIEDCRKHFFFSYDVITETIIWSITHMLNKETVHILIESKLFNDILNLLKKETISINLLDTVIWFYSVFFKLKIFPSLNTCKVVIVSIKKIIDLNDTNILINSIWVLSYMSELNFTEMHTFLFDNAIINKLLSFSLDNYSIILPIITLIGNLLCEEDYLIEVILIYLETFRIRCIRLFL